MLFPRRSDTMRFACQQGAERRAILIAIAKLGNAAGGQIGRAHGLIAASPK